MDGWKGESEKIMSRLQALSIARGGARGVKKEAKLDRAELDKQSNHENQEEERSVGQSKYLELLLSCLIL